MARRKMSEFWFLGNLLWTGLANKAPFCGLRFWGKMPETIVNNFTAFISLKHMKKSNNNSNNNEYLNKNIWAYSMLNTIQ